MDWKWITFSSTFEGSEERKYNVCSSLFVMRKEALQGFGELFGLRVVGGSLHIDEATFQRTNELFMVVYLSL